MQDADRQSERHAWRRGLEPKIGLSGKLLLLTIPLILIAEILIYVPSIANFRLNRLNDRLAAAHTAALVLVDAAVVPPGASTSGGGGASAPAASDASGAMKITELT